MPLVCHSRTKIISICNRPHTKSRPGYRGGCMLHLVFSFFRQAIPITKQEIIVRFGVCGE